MARKTTQRNGSPLYWSAETWAFISLRLFLGLRLLVAGWGKFVNEAGFSFSNYYDGFATFIINTYTEQTALPKFLVATFAYSLGYAEIILGAFLLVGVKTKYVLALIGLTFVTLSFGNMVLGDNQGIAYLGIHLLITAAALYFVRHNKLEALL